MKLSSYSHKGNSLSQPVKYKRVFPTARFSSPIVIWVLNRCFPSACLASLSTTTTSPPPPPPPQPSCLASLRFYYFSLYLDASGSRAPAHATNITRSRVSTDPSERDETLTRIGQHGPTYCGTNVYHARVLARYKRNFPSTIAFYRFPFSPRISFFLPSFFFSPPNYRLSFPSFSLFFSFFFLFLPSFRHRDERGIKERRSRAGRRTGSRSELTRKLLSISPATKNSSARR